MVVAEGGREKIGETVPLTVTSVLQTSAGRMIFGRMKDEGEGLHRAAVEQPRQIERPERKSKETSGRNPRRQ